MQDYAVSIGKVAGELDGAERQQAFMNAVLKESEKNAGAYEASMTTASKQLRSFSRDMWELMRVMGTPFLGAFSSIVKVMRDLAAMFKKAFEEGGAFYTSMMQLGAIAAILADYIAALAKRFAEWFIGLAQGKDLLTFINDSILNMSPLAFSAAVAVATLAAAWVALKVAWTVGSGIKVTIQYLQFFAYGVKALVAALPVLGAMLSKVFIGIGTQAAGIITGIATKLAAVISGVIPALVSGLTAVAAALGLTVGQLLLVVAAVAAAVAIIYILATNTWGARDALMDFFKSVGEFATAAWKQISTVFQNIVTWVSNFIVNAFNWGVNLVTQFANGIINAASSVLTAAINYIGSILSYWFAPGSPPNVAPNLTEWGIGAVNSWLEGFTQGDWNILQGIQQPLQQIFGYLESIGQMTDAGQAFADISKQIIAAIDSGTGFEAVLASITDQAGVFGPELAQLTEQYFQMAGALADVEAHEKALTDARKAQVDANKNTNKLIREYNQMLRGGASKEALAAKLAEINASKAAEKAAAANVTQEEKNLQAAYDSAQAMKDQIAMQEKLLAMLLQLAQAQTKPITPAVIAPTPPTPGGGGGGGGIPGGGLDLPLEGEPIEIPKVDNIIDNFKKQIQAKLAGIWQSVKTRWAILWTGIVRDIRGHWNDIITYGKRTWANTKEWLGETWAKTKAKAIEIWGGIATWFRETWAKIRTKAIEIWGTVKTAVVTKWNEITASVRAKVAEMKTAISTKWEEIKTDVRTKIEELKTGIAEKIAEIKEGIKEKIEEWKQAIRDKWDEIKAAVKEKIVEWFASMGIDFDEFVGRWKAIWEDVKLIIRTVWERIREKVIEIWTRIRNKAIEIWTRIRTVIAEKIEAVRAWIEEKVLLIQAKWKEIWDAIQKKAEEIWTAIHTYVTEKIEAVRAWIEEKVLAIQTKWNEIWDAIKTKVEEIWTAVHTFVTEKITAIKDWIGQEIDAIKLKWDTFWDGFKAKAVDIWDGPDGIKAKIEAAINSVKSFFTNPEGTGLLDIITNLATDAWDAAVNIGANIINGIKEGLKGAVSGLLEGTTGIVEKILDIIKSLLNIGSPSKVLKKYGMWAMEGFAEGIQKGGALPQKAMFDAINRIVLPITSMPQSVSHITNKTVNMNMGGVNINNGMDIASLRGLLKSVIHEELGGI
jgi:phage-related protein